MNIVREHKIVTDNYNFTVSISKIDGWYRFSATYYGSGPATAPVFSPGGPLQIMNNLEPETIEGDDMGDLLIKCKEEITKIGGNIIKEYQI